MELYLGNVAIICGLVFLVAGYIMYKFPPKNINYLYGYRTGTSMKSQERWDFAQRYSALQMVRGGAVLTIAGLLMAVLSFNMGIILAAGMVLLFAVTGYLFYSTERAIKQNFKN